LKNWLAFWRQISERRLVDMVREECGRDGKKGEVLLAKRSPLVESDLADIPVESVELKEEIQKLPNDLRRILTAVLRYGGPAEAQKKLDVSASWFYAKLEKAYSLLRSRLETAG
jgi:DNA-directed RNA polymerase specialized sigma24 family protein